MPAARKTKIGFIGSSAPASPHHESFKAVIPKDIDFTIVQESGANTSLYDARGKVDALIGEVQQLVAERGWQGVIISGAPKEALNPGMWERVSAALKVPVSLALICAGSDGENAARQIQRIATGWRLRAIAEPIIVCTHAQTPEAILAPKQIDAFDLNRCEEMGATLAAGLVLGIY
jgi:hypothetical protein